MLADLYDLIGLGDLNLGQDSAAKIAFAEAIERAPDYALPYSNRGYLFHQEGDIKSALDDYTQAIVHDPLFTMGYTNQGSLLEELGAYDAALKDYQAAVAIDSHCANCWVDLGALVANYKGDEHSAFQDFTHAIDSDPANVAAYTNRAISDAALGMPDLQLADLTKALDLQPGYNPAILHLAEYYAWQNRFDEAIAQFSDLIDGGSGYTAFALLGRSEVYLARGDYDLAIADGSNAITDSQLIKNIIVAHLMRGTAYLYQKNYTAALADYKTVWSMGTPVTAVASYVADPTLLVVNVPAKIDKLTLSLAFDPNDQKLLSQVAPLYMEDAQWQAAMNAYQRYFSVTGQTPPAGLMAILTFVTQ